MLKFIFKNYDSFLESVRYNIDNLLHKKNSQNSSRLSLKPCEILDIEIEKQEKNLKEKESIKIKQEIREHTLYLRLKKMALGSTNLYIKRAEDILKDEVEESAYEALDYLKRVPKNLSKEQLHHIALFKALIYELLEDFEEASNEYKSAIKYNNTEDALRRYKEFVERSREVLSWYKSKKDQLRFSSLNIHNIAKKEDMPNIAKSLDNIAKYYARSPKSRETGKRYFKEVIKIYKKLSKEEPKKYSCDYIKSLIDAVEFFMFSTVLLKEANDLLNSSSDCVEMRVYLSEKIKELKEKNFIKKSTTI